jgi:hypothetical protein
MKKRWKNRKWHFLEEITPDLIMSLQQRSSNEQEIFTPKPLKINLKKIYRNYLFFRLIQSYLCRAKTELRLSPIETNS